MKRILLIGNDTRTHIGYGMHEMNPGDVLFFPCIQSKERNRIRALATYYRKEHKKNIHTRTRTIDGEEGLLVYSEGILPSHTWMKKWRRLKKWNR